MRCASHEHVVDLIRSSGSLVTMTVVSQNFPNNFQQEQQQVHSISNDFFHAHLLIRTAPTNSMATLSHSISNNYR